MYPVLETLLILLISVIDLTSSVCPNEDLLYPCYCESDSIYCIGNEYINIKHIFNLLSQKLKDDEKHFEKFYLNNTAINELEENTFYDITFSFINIQATNLTLINTFAFSETNLKTNTIYTYAPVENRPPKYDFFIMLSLMKNINAISIYGNNITEVPSYAFKPILGNQNKLKFLNIHGEENLRLVNDYAFYNLGSLTHLGIYANSKNYIFPNAMNFHKDSNELLHVFLDSFYFNGSYLGNNTFSNTRRPTVLHSDCRKYSCQLSFLNENVFSHFFSLNIKNRIDFTNHLIDCDDCRSYWLRKNVTHFERIDGLSCTNGNNFLNNNNFINCK